MGKMIQGWSMATIKKTISDGAEFKRGSANENSVVKVLYDACLDVARRAKAEHGYRNIKGELESSIGVVILKDRRSIKRWSLLAASGRDPSRGLRDIKDVISKYIIGRSSLPDGTAIPEKGIVGIVFAAAPYAGIVEGRGRKVLDAFKPNGEQIYSILKTIIK